MNICGENRQLLTAEKRYTQLQNQQQGLNKQTEKDISTAKPLPRRQPPTNRIQPNKRKQPARLLPLLYRLICFSIIIIEFHYFDITLSDQLKVG